MPVTEEIEEDFLEVDKPIPGQNYVCMSFVSPEKILNQKEQFMYHNYLRYRLAVYDKMFNDSFNTMIEEQDDGMVEISRLFDMKKSMDKQYAEDKVEFEKFKEQFDDFKFRDEQMLSDKFDKLNDFQTSVRGIKVRGVYDTRREAEIRAKVLQRQDQSFDVFVGQVGYWLPWHPESNKVEDQEYLNNELNTLVKEYKKNEAKKDMFYQEQKAQRTQEANTAAQRLREKLNKKRQMEEDAKKQITSETSETSDVVTESSDNNTTTSQENTDSNMTDSIRNNIDLNKLVSEDEPKISEVEDDESVQSSQPNDSVGGLHVDRETLQGLESVDPWMQRKMQTQ